VARYQEKNLSLVPTVLLLVLAFIVAFAPWTLGMQELSWREGYLIAQAQGMEFTPLPIVMAHGEAIPNVTVLFPMLSRVLIEFGCPAEISGRVLSLLGLLGVTLLVFLVAWRTRKKLSIGACAAAVMLTNLLAIDKTGDGFAHWLFVLVTFGGQLLWYYFAALRGNWSKAWLIGFIACSAGFALRGIVGVIFFMLPLVFMRRPLGIFQRLRNRGVMLGLGLLLLTILLWYLPYHQEGVRLAASYPQINFLDNADYLKHLLTFPWDMGLRVLPWALLAWAPFCVAIQTLDTTPIFSRFLRTLFLTDFFLLWITPLDDVYDWLILLPPLAVMTALNYELNIRRYGDWYRKLGNAAAALLLPGSALMILGFFLLPSHIISEYLHLDRSIGFSNDPSVKALGVTAGIAAAVIALVLLKMREKPPIWCYWLLIALGPLLAYHTIVFPYQAQDEPRRERALQLANALQNDGAKAGTLVYKYDLSDLFAESVYMETAVHKISALSELPKAEKQVVYLLAPSFPNHPERSWKSLLAQPLVSRGRKFNLWRGQWQENEPAPRKPSPLLQEIARPVSIGGKLP